MQQQFINLIAGVYSPVSFETITVATTAIGFTAAEIYKANLTEIDITRAVITAETAEMRYRYDGTDPTSTVGHVLGAGDTLVMMGDDALKNFKAIRTGGTSGKLQVTYER